MSKIPSDDVLESLYKLRIRASDQLKSSSDLYRRGNSSNDIDAQWSEVEDEGEKEHRSETSITKFRGQKRDNWDKSSGYESQGIEWERNLLSVESKRSVFERRPMQFPTRESWSWKTDSKSRSTLWVTNTKKVEVRREKRASEAEASLGSPADSRAKTCWKVLALEYHATIQFYKTKSGCKFGAECSFPHWKFEEQPNKRLKKGGDQSAVAVVKSVRQLGCVSQDTEPPESVSMSQKGTKVLGPIRRVRFTRAALRQANIWETKGPSMNTIQVKSSHQRGLYAVKIEDRSQEETERQERCARGDAWKLAKNICKLKENERSYIPFAHGRVDYAGRIHQKSRRKESLWWILEQACIWSVRKTLTLLSWRPWGHRRSPTTVMTANGEVQTKEEATVYVRELDLFVTLMLLEETSAVLSLGKLCDDHGYTYHWTSGQKPHLTQKVKRIDCNFSKNVLFVVFGLSTSCKWVRDYTCECPRRQAGVDMLCYDTKGTLTQNIMTIELKPPWCETFGLEVLLFADLTTSEFVSQYTGYKPNNVWSDLERSHWDSWCW